MIFSLFAYGQTYTIQGKVINKTTGELLVGCSVFNVSKQIGTVSNEEGRYRLTVEKGDLIQFTFVGMGVIERYILDEEDITIEMNYQVRKIKPVTIKGQIAAKSSSLYNPNYDKEKKPIFLEPIRKSSEQMMKDAAPQINGTGITMSPITLLYLAFNKKEKRRLDAIIDISKLDASHQKYSLDFISLITKVDDREELKDIKAYCYFPHDQVLNTSYYELGLMVKECYLDFLEDKKNQNSTDK